MAKPVVNNFNVNGNNVISDTQPNNLTVNGNTFEVTEVGGVQWPALNLWDPLGLWVFYDVTLNAGLSNATQLKATFQAAFTGIVNATPAIATLPGMLSLQVLNRPGDAPSTSLTKTIWATYPDPTNIFKHE